MSRPVNFAQQDPLIMLLGSLGSGGVGQAIEEQEAAGAAQMADPQCEVIPARFSTGIDEEVLEEWGFVLGDVDFDDPLFRAAVLPVGWSRRRTEHPLWTEIADREAAVRAVVFYKASRHNRTACLHLAAHNEDH